MVGGEWVWGNLWIQLKRGHIQVRVEVTGVHQVCRHMVCALPLPFPPTHTVMTCPPFKALYPPPHSLMDLRTCCVTACPRCPRPPPQTHTQY
jgi:hypothetical protein